MNKQETIELKVISVGHYTPTEIRGNYTTIEDIKGKDSGGQDVVVRRFIPPDEYRVKVGRVYQGRLKLKPKDKPDYSDTINELKALNGFNGIEDIGNDCWDTTDPAQEQLEHQAKMKAWGDIHSATPIVASIYKLLIEQGKTKYADHKELKKLIIEVAGVCEQSHDELTQQYIKLSKESK